MGIFDILNSDYASGGSSLWRGGKRCNQRIKSITGRGLKWIVSGKCAVSAGHFHNMFLQ